MDFHLYYKIPFIEYEYLFKSTMNRNSLNKVFVPLSLKTWTIFQLVIFVANPTLWATLNAIRETHLSFSIRGKVFFFPSRESNHNWCAIPLSPQIPLMPQNITMHLLANHFMIWLFGDKIAFVQEVKFRIVQFLIPAVPGFETASIVQDTFTPLSLILVFNKSAKCDNLQIHI